MHYFSYMSTNPLVSFLTFLVFVLWGLTFYIQFKFSSAVKKNSMVSTEINGFDLAHKMLKDQNIENVTVEVVNSKIGSEFYDPRKLKIVLSEETAWSSNVASNAIVAHEVGHAIQHQNKYSWMQLRNATARPLNVISTVGWVALIGLSIASIYMGTSKLYLFIALAINILVLGFQLITLPVEFNASNLALSYLQTNVFTSQAQIVGSKKVLQAAALTYILSALTVLITVLRLLAIFSSSNKD